MRAGRFVSAGLTALALASSPPSRAAEPDVTWAGWTASPIPVPDRSLHPLELAAISRCGTADAGLEGTARAVLVERLRGAPMPEMDALARLQRSAGEPHPWPRAWAIRAHSLDPADAAARLGDWLGDGDRGAHRCGAAAGVGTDGVQMLVVVVVDALADLAPFPTRVRTGQWLTLEARLHVPVSGASVLVLGPSGAPRTVPSWLDGSTVRARFAADQPGEHDVQVVAESSRGPRPVLEATFFADVSPSLDPPEGTAPGEDITSGSDDDRLARMVGAARVSVGLPALQRDARLDAVARTHAERMAREHQLAHDAGDGDPVERLRAAGLEARDVGENVAHARTVALAHRALWASPAHRLNILRGEYGRIGVAVVADEKGEAWVVETFAGGLSP